MKKRSTSVGSLGFRTLSCVAAIIVAACTSARSNDRPIETAPATDVASHNLNHTSGGDSQDSGDPATPVTSETLYGYDDWEILSYVLNGHPNFLAGGTTPGDDLSLDDIEALDVIDDDCNGNSIPDYEDVGACTEEDCNGNGVPDQCDIAMGNSIDAEPDLIPDECQCTTPLPQDVATLSADRGYFAWTDVTDSESYDLLRGDLMSLRSSSGDFSTSIDECLANDFGATSIIHTAAPLSGEAWFFVLRVLNCSGNGSFDTGESSQSGLRDAEINASASTCPIFDCGNGIQEMGEVCDKWDLDCETCQSQGLGLGALACNATCDGYDSSACSGA